MMHSTTFAAYSRTALSTANGGFGWNRTPARILIDAPGHDWWPHIENRLGELLRLEVGWDGYCGIPASRNNVYFALNLLRSICWNGTPAPQIVPGSNGDLQIEWHTEKADIELHVRGPNDVGAWRATQATGHEGEEIQLTNNFIELADWTQELTETHIASVASAA